MKTSIVRRLAHTRSGFSLTEILVSLAVLGVLASILFSIFGSLQSRTHATKCAANLRQIGGVLMIYALDNDNFIYFQTSTGGTHASWLDHLRGRVNDNFNRDVNAKKTDYLGTNEIAVCPAWGPLPYGSGSFSAIYGAPLPRTPALDPATRLNQQNPAFSNTSSGISLSVIDNPSRYWLLADSYTTTYRGQTFVIHPNSSASNTTIHLRHGGAANVLFADGHVELMDGDGLKALPYNPVTTGHDENENRVTF